MASETSEHVIIGFANSNTSNNNTVTASTRFWWDKEQKVENVMKCLANYKAKIEFSNKDFNVNKVQQYEEVRKGMAHIYNESKEDSQFKRDIAEIKSNICKCHSW